jgi:hypothetical protein
MTDQVLLDGLPRIDLADLIEGLKEKDRRCLSEVIEAYQEKFLDELCGLKYKPEPNSVYRRAGSNRRPKTIVTPLGVVRFKTWKVKNHVTGEVFTPLLYILQVQRRKYTRPVKAQCAELTSKLSYGDAREEYHRLTGVLIPKSTIHGFTQEIAPGMLEAQLNMQPQPQGLVIMADETEVRAIKTGQQNQVRIALSVRDGSKRLLNLTVNKPYQPMPRRSILVSDGEPDLKHQDPQLHQLCILHAIKRLTYTLWRERASKEEREHLKSELERILYTLINSTRTHASDGDHQALRRRIESTLNQLSNLAVTLKRQGYREASQFIIRNSKLLVTFAELALKGIRIPYTTNQIERLMGEIAKRCKHQWAHWSCEGLKNTLTFILIHYTNPTLYEEYWKTYIHQCPIKTTILTTQI